MGFTNKDIPDSLKKSLQLMERRFEREIRSLRSQVTQLGGRTVSNPRGTAITIPQSARNITIKTGSAQVASGSNVITFEDGPFKTKNYRLVIDGVYIDSTFLTRASWKRTAKNADSFTILCNDAGTIDYIAIYGAGVLQ